jgi:hypothetical protein
VHTILKCKSYFVHVPWGVPSWFFRTFGWSYHNIFLCPIVLSDPLIACLFCWGISPFAILLQLLDSQYSLISSYYWSMEMPIWFYSFYEKS